MAEGKKSFIVYTGWKLWLDALTNEQKGEWLEWMFDYTNDLNPKYPEDKVVEVACRMAQDTLKRDLKKYEAKVERIKVARNQNPNNNKELDTNKNQTEISSKSVQNQTEISSDNVNDNVNVNVNDIKKEKNKEKKAVAFKTPTLEEITQYCQERNNLVDPERFYNFYSAKGWMVGKNKMKDWKAAVRTWESEAGFKSDNAFKGFRKLGEEELGFDGYPLVVDGDRFWQMARDNETQAECDARVRATKERIDRERQGNK